MEVGLNTGMGMEVGLNTRMWLNMEVGLNTGVGLNMGGVFKHSLANTVCIFL